MAGDPETDPVEIIKSAFPLQADGYWLMYSTSWNPSNEILLSKWCILIPFLSQSERQVGLQWLGLC